MGCLLRMLNYYEKKAAHYLSKLMVAQELCDDEEIKKSQLEYDNYQQQIKRLRNDEQSI